VGLVYFQVSLVTERHFYDNPSACYVGVSLFADIGNTTRFMQSTLLDILILGLLVLLFGSIYRNRRTLRLRYWIAGWFLVLAHFALLLPNPVSDFWSNLDGALCISALILGGVCFLLASSTVRMPSGPHVGVQLLLILPPVLFMFLSIFGIKSMAALAGSFLLLQLALFFFIYRWWRSKPLVIVGAILCAVAVSIWAADDMLRHRAAPGVNAALAQIYFLNAITYWYSFRRWSMGVITSTVGLAAWASVFPVATTIFALFPNAHLSPELWNLPKYFVEFGMILTMLEDEVIETARQREEYRVLFDGNPHPMWIFDQETLAFLKVNAAAVAHYGYSEDEFLSKTLRDIRPAGDVPRLEHRLKDAGKGTLYSGPWTHIRKDGSQIQVEVASHGIDFEGRQARFSLVQDITERQQLYERLVYQAHHDILTGLPNRLLLKDRMEQMLAAAERLGQQAAVLCMDLDRFKQINDTYGHHVGDVCLQRVATALRDRLRMTDTMARSGGEEFIVLLGQLKSPDDAAHVAQVLLDSFRQSLLIDGHTITLSASIGIAMYPTDGTAAQVLWRLADSAMYRAKRSGGDRFLFAEREYSTLSIDEIEMRELDKAIRDDR
jgi:diguanylate cyclase (GGDEF)-like protein/PAS domain S-box-containing protein